MTARMNPSLNHNSPYKPTGRPPTQVYTRGTVGAVRTAAATIRPRSRDSPSQQTLITDSTGASAEDGAKSRKTRGRSQPRKSREGILSNRDRTRRVTTLSPQPRGGGGLPHTHHRHRQVTDDTHNVSDGSVDLSCCYPHSTASQSSEHEASVNSAPSNWLRKGHLLHHHEQPGGRASATPTEAEMTKNHIRSSRHVVDDLVRSQGAAERRIAAVTNACDVFDHADESFHNIELHHGAFAALAKLLTIAKADDEIRMILAATEMVCRGSPKHVQAAYSQLPNNINMLGNLLRLLDRLETRTMTHADISILNISKILANLSRSSELRATLCRQQGMLTCLARVSTAGLTTESRLLRMRILANLANSEDNKVLMYEQAGMLDSCLRIGHFDANDVARQHAAVALMEFSSAPANQVSMARNDTVLGTLVKMVLVEKSATTRESAITALQNLAFTKENRLQLVTFRQGIVLEALKKTVSQDPDAKARRRSAGALTNLACDETAAAMGDHKGLLDALAVVSTKDESSEVQTRAAQALTKIAGSVTVHMKCHEALLDALVVASLSKTTNSVTAVLRVKARQPENRQALARHPGVVDTLADICVSDTAAVADRDNSVRAIMHLVNEDRNRKILCNKTILDALVTGATYKDPDLEEARDSAVRAIERLATEISNRATMAHHKGLIIAVANAVEREAAWERAGRESEYGYLAKPLLMSLLVAM